MNKNVPKYLSYNKGWARINSALEAGFYLEAITIQESIISDRLLSYVLGVAPNSKINTKTSLGKLIVQWRKYAGVSLERLDGTDLGRDTDAWRIKRNTVVHGLVKSAPGGTPELQSDDFFILARQSAEEGKALAREIQNWHRKMLRKAKA
jgi:hypothetical protein